MGSRTVGGPLVNPERIYTFGCSYTYGAKVYDPRKLQKINHEIPPEPMENNPSWPEQLSLLMPDTEILDYSFLGTSLEYTTYQFNQIKQSITDKDLTIVCATNPYRYTHWADGSLEDDALRIQKSSNYEKYSPHIRHKLIRYHPGWERNRSRNQNLNPGVYWYRYSQHNKELEATMHGSLLEYLNTHADLVFTHHDYTQNYHTPLTENIPCVETMLGTEQFDRYVHDDGKHFDLEGAKWVAEWVYRQITES